ncbi:MAG: hypothetical protein VX278_16145 [Myxococcota bacterium]|nr:hypothetical protein [Myxococcota bacterium]
MQKTFSSLLISQKEGIVIGKLEDFLFNLETHQIKGWLIKRGGLFSSLGGIDSDAIVLCGRDVILIDTVESIEWDVKRVSHKKSSWASQYKGKKLIQRNGQVFAEIQRLFISEDAKSVVGLEIGDERVIKLNQYIVLRPDGGVLPRKYDIVSVASDDENLWTKIRGFFAGDDEDVR